MISGPPKSLAAFPTKCPADSSNGRPWRGPSCISQSSFWPTGRPGTWTPQLRQFLSDQFGKFIDRQHTPTENGGEIPLDAIDTILVNQTTSRLISTYLHKGADPLFWRQEAHTSKETRTYLQTAPNRFEFVFAPKHTSRVRISLYF